METKFKKGESVRAIKDSDDGRFKKGDELIVNSVSLLGCLLMKKEFDLFIISWEDANDLLEQTSPNMPEPIEHQRETTKSPRLASEMTLRDRYELAKEIYIELIKKGVPITKGLAHTSVDSADALIQALNEKP